MFARQYPSSNPFQTSIRRSRRYLRIRSGWGNSPDRCRWISRRSAYSTLGGRGRRVQSSDFH